MMAQATSPIISQKPFAAIFVALALMVAVIGASRLAGFQPSTSLPVQTAEETRWLHFADAPQGSVVVRDVKTGETVKTFGRGEGSFVRATLRALVHDRIRKGTSNEGDFRLERHKGPQFFLIDEATGKTISLNAFGPSNTAAFAAFMSNQKKGEGQ
jgi:putative photosynthetic complex assembly protein